jgi:hypothetical protein
MNIAIAAMLFAAAFAGVALIADEDVAAGGEPAAPVAVKTITYEVDGDSATRKLAADATTFIAPSLADLGLSSEKEFIQWKLASGAVFKAGQEYAVTALGSADSNGNVKLTAEFDENIYITFNVGEQSFKCIVKDGALDKTSGAYKDLEAFIKAIDQTKFEIGKLMNGEAEAGSIAIAKDGAVTVAVDDLSKSAVLTLQLTPIYNVDFIVDGTVIAKCASNEFAQGDKTLQPIDPVKANYTFMGWAVDGKIVSKVIAGDIIIPADYKFEADTAFTAVFEPIQLTLTLVVGEFQTTQPALYGQKITAPGLPDGYSHWATMAVVDEKEVYTEFDFSQAIVENMTLYAQKAEKVYTISFISEGAVIGGPYDVSKPYTIPADPVVEGKKFVGWFIGDYKVADIKAYVAEHPDEDIVLTASFTQADAPAGPGFFETNEGKCVAVIIGVALLAFIYAVYTNMFGMKDLLTSFKIQRVKKE